MFGKTTLAVCAITFAAFAASHAAGTWKLNTAKSKYTGMPMPKEMTLTYTPEGEGWRSEGKGTSGDGQPVSSSFTYMKDNEEAKMMGSPLGDTIMIKNGNSDSSSATFKRDGKVVGNAKRMISSDGKTMTITANTMLADGKKVSYTAVYEKQ